MSDVIRRRQIRDKVQAEIETADRLRNHVPCPVLQARLGLLASQLQEIARVFLDAVDGRSELEEREWLNAAEFTLELRVADLDALARTAAQHAPDWLD